MENQKDYNVEEIFSKALRAGRRTYFFDVRETKAGDYYLTITESKKFTNEDGTFYFKKHKIYLYKEDFAEFNSSLKETCDFIIENKGEEVISEKHDKDFESKKENKEVPKPKSEEPENVKEEESVEESVEEEKDFADVDFEDDAE
ncbi:MAG: PUR family DNA/RNA-binding protein [Cryomorphaceae bacterium]|jgi:hypothetical protein|nr:PUR family DNA/RNA-binding protein [Cryomorphaceae bacterium]MBT3684708.1 PUR family DNA/RNA-binding protein [Cryomorphaceae bacterium]MBT4237433.1 PUR family DNA/RNA-binding protein [Cryomorphaceae bacterium]MBT4813007.1 PUR family DNA/RNA-binding protein [Cryomorphaceae bacterium]MBT5417340.1 PUR family DNA/RNA-binding protein [Cryomorphaceae bacterium]